MISPRVMGKSMELHPLAAIFGVLAGGEIAGVLGIYLSIPVMASLRIVWRRWRLYAEKKRFGPLNEYSFGGEITSCENSSWLLAPSFWLITASLTPTITSERFCPTASSG